MYFQNRKNSLAVRNTENAEALAARETAISADLCDCEDDGDVDGLLDRDCDEPPIKKDEIDLGRTGGWEEDKAEG